MIGFLDAAQAMNLTRFLLSERDEVGVWLLPYDLFLWAKGIEPFPHLAAFRVPGYE